MRTGRRLGWWVLVACLLLAGCSMTARRATSGRSHVPAPVVVVGVGGLTWDAISPEATPRLWQLLADDGAAAAATAVRQIGPSCPVDGWLSLSSGRPTAGPRSTSGGADDADPNDAGSGDRETADADQAGDDPPRDGESADDVRASSPGSVRVPQDGACGPLPEVRPTADRAGGTGRAAGQAAGEAAGEAFVPAWRQLQDLQDSWEFDPHLGLLADSLAELNMCATAVGPGAALALADPEGIVSRYQEGLGTGSFDCPVTVVDAGRVADRDQDLSVVDRRVGEVLDGAPEDASVLVTGVSEEPGGHPELAGALLSGPPVSGTPRFLVTSSTRWDGVIRLLDVPSTLMAAVDSSDPDGFSGAPIRLGGQQPAGPEETVRVLDDITRAEQVRGIWAGDFRNWLGASQLVLYGVALLAIGSGRGGQAGRDGGPRSRDPDQNDPGNQDQDQSPNDPHNPTVGLDDDQTPGPDDAHGGGRGGAGIPGWPGNHRGTRARDLDQNDPGDQDLGLDDDQIPNPDDAHGGGRGKRWRHGHPGTYGQSPCRDHARGQSWWPASMQRWGGPAFTAVVLCSAALPVAAYLVTLTGWWRAGSPDQALWGGMAAIAVGIAVVAGRLPKRPLWWVTGGLSLLTFAVLVVDALAGTPLHRGSLLGPSPALGGRFFGFGNDTFCVFVVVALLLAGAVAEELLTRGRRRLAVGAVVGLGALTVLVDVWPTWGADVGGGPALLPGIALLALVVAGIEVTVPRLAGAAAGGVALVAAVALADWLRPERDRSHAGRFVQEVLDGDAWEIVARKAGYARDSLNGGIPMWVTLAVLVAAAAALLRPERYAPSPLLAAFDQWPTFRATLGAILLTILLGSFINDYGLRIATISLTMGLPLVALTCARAVASAAPSEPRSDMGRELGLIAARVTSTKRPTLAP